MSNITRNLRGIIKDTLSDPNSSDARLNEFAIYDKVINVLFIREDLSYFCVRSDYEVIQLKNGAYRFAKCVQKPEIRITYKRAANSVVLQFNVKVTNLHLIPSKDQAQESHNSAANPIKWVVAQLGYFNQFPNFLDPSLAYSIDHYNKLLDFRKNVQYEEWVGSVLAAYPTSIPPDGETTFTCAVGFSDMSIISDNLQRNYAELADTDIGFETFGEYIKRNIGERFARDEAGAGELAKLPDGRDQRREYEIVMRNNNTTVSTARLLGYKTIVTPKLDESFKKDADKNGAKFVIPDLNASRTLDNAINNLMELYSYTRSFLFDSSTLVFYHEDEKAHDIYDMLIAEGHDMPLTGLPAVYSITYGALRSIKCPFTTRIRPFQNIKFSTRYNIGSLVGYYYQPKKGDESFLVINFTVDFSTKDEHNEMELLTTDA